MDVAFSIIHIVITYFEIMKTPRKLLIYFALFYESFYLNFFFIDFTYKYILNQKTNV